MVVMMQLQLRQHTVIIVFIVIANTPVWHVKFPFFSYTQYAYNYHNSRIQPVFFQPPQINKIACNLQQNTSLITQQNTSNDN